MGFRQITHWSLHYSHICCFLGMGFQANNTLEPALLTHLLFPSMGFQANNTLEPALLTTFAVSWAWVSGQKIHWSLHYSHICCFLGMGFQANNTLEPALLTHLLLPGHGFPGK
ncbi:hypothetical protein CEXT_622691 [Caerostris extrusa]|uniref:Uncharacterized protein n=1 Tax=Caerostris extrusa TaxID=172846 RepID=A0AAV4N2J6_CAEEX|nr:hypothetical protein CEXT_622691 [Caerostris extrusa]